MRNPIPAAAPVFANTAAKSSAARPQTTRGQRMLLSVLSATMLIDALEVSIVVVALPSIAGGLHLAMSSAQWLMSGFALGFGGMLLFGGRVTGRLDSAAAISSRWRATRRCAWSAASRRMPGC